MTVPPADRSGDVPDDVPDGKRAAGRRWQQLLTAMQSPTELVRNVSTRVEFARLGLHLVPVTINEQDYDNAWVCSPYTSAVTYPLDELSKIPSVTLRLGLSGIVRTLGPLLRACRINRVVTLNNWLLSTNLYPNTTPETIARSVTVLAEQYPRHAILVRSLNRVTNAGLIDSLSEAGCLLAPSRQVYLYDGADPQYLRRTNSLRDLRLLNSHTPSLVMQHDECFDSSRISELYELLYLRKYSYHNPQFTSRFIHVARDSGVLELFGLRDEQGQLEAVVGTIEVNGVLTAPVVGYDTSLPQGRGLYRMLMAHVLQLAAERKQLLNLSAGAGSFKRLRGGIPELEYSAVYISHLPLRQQLAWRTLATLLQRIGAPVLQRYAL